MNDSVEMFEKEKCLEFALKKRESSRVFDVLVRLSQILGPMCEKMRKPLVLQLKRWNLSMRLSNEERRGREGL